MALFNWHTVHVYPNQGELRASPSLKVGSWKFNLKFVLSSLSLKKKSIPTFRSWVCLKLQKRWFITKINRHLIYSCCVDGDFELANTDLAIFSQITFYEQVSVSSSWEPQWGLQISNSPRSHQHITQTECRAPASRPPLVTDSSQPLNMCQTSQRPPSVSP